MRVLKMVLIVVVVVIGLAAAAAVVALRFLPETDLIRDNLTRSMSDATGHNVTVGAVKTSLSLSRLWCLTVDDVSVKSRDGAKLLSAQRVEFVPSLASIWERRISVTSVDIRGMHAILRRDQGGQLESFVARKPVSEPAPVPDREKARLPTGAPVSPQERPVPSGSDIRVQWSVDSVRLVDARVDLIDAGGAPGTLATVSVAKINGALDRIEAGNFTVKLTGELTGQGITASPVYLDAALTPAEDFSSLVAAAVNLHVTSMDTKLLRPYVPADVRLGEIFDRMDVRARMDLKKGSDTVVSVQAHLKSASVQAVQFDVDASAVLRNDLSGIRSVKADAYTHVLPMAFLAAYLPRDFPVSREKGSAKVSLKGQWDSPASWTLSGTVGIDGAVLTGPYRAIADTVQARMQAGLTPQVLKIENLEVSGAGKIGTLAGTVSDPLSQTRELDLKGEMSVKAEWLKAFGVKLPADASITPAVPVRFQARGKMENVSLELVGDLTGTAIRLGPHFEKAQAAKGQLLLKGNIIPSQPSSSKSVACQALLALRFTDVAIRAVPTGPQITKCAINLESKVLISGNRADLKDASLAVRRGGSEENLLTAKADVVNLGTGSVKIQGDAVAKLDQAFPAFCGLEQAPGFKLSGSSLLTLKFKGSDSAMEWSADLPLKTLDVAVDDAFKKPAGVAGDVKASGNWTHQELTLGSGKLTLPGIVVTGQGTLRDKTGKLKGLSLVAKNTRLEELSKLVPALRDQGVSGNADITVSLKPADQGTETKATAQLAGVDCRPPNAGWTLEGVTASLETDGRFLEITELKGKLKTAIEGPIVAKGRLEKIKSVETMSGDLSVRVGKGHINPGQLKKIISQANILIGTLLDPQNKEDRANPLEMDSAMGTFQFGSGAVKTEDLRLRGPDLTMGAVGAVQLKKQTIDGLVGIKTFSIVPSVVANIPQVRKLVKEHSGLLKNLGLDKELKRLGIDESEPSPDKPQTPVGTRTPMTVMLKLHGPASAPTITPVLESALDKTAAARIKSLMEQ